MGDNDWSYSKCLKAEPEPPRLMIVQYPFIMVVVIVGVGNACSNVTPLLDLQMNDY